MTNIKVYFGKNASRKHEWEQFIEFYQILKQNLKEFTSDIYLIHGVYFEDTEVDCLLLTTKGLYIIDLKDLSGHIVGGDNKQWELIKNNSSVYKFDLYEQAITRRSIFFSMLKRIRNQHNLHYTNSQLRKTYFFGYFQAPCTFDVNLQYNNKRWFGVTSSVDIVMNLKNFQLDFEYQDIDLQLIIDDLELGYIIEEEPRINAMDLGITEKWKIEERETIFKLQLQQFTKFWITKDHVKADLDLYSLSTNSIVEYTALSVIHKGLKEKEENKPSNQKDEKKDLIQSLDETNDGITWLIGKPGSGKSSSSKEYLRYKIALFLDKSNNFPIRTEAKNIHSIDIKDLIPKIGTEFIPIVEKYEIEGKLEIIVDALDESNLEDHQIIIMFLKSQIKKKNKLIITSRFIDNNIFNEINKYYEELKLENKQVQLFIQNLDKIQLEQFIKQRISGIEVFDLNKIILLVNRAGIETIPLWIDLLIDYTDIASLNISEISEIQLLAHWVDNTKKRKSDLSTIMSTVTKIAFENISQRFPSTLTESWIKHISKNDEVFVILIEIGWVVPSGNFQGERSYSFVHYRLQEYLAARYIWSNWDAISELLFNKTIGLLSQSSKDVIIELSFLDAYRVNENLLPVLNDRILKIAYDGDLHEEFNDEKLKDPFLAVYIWALLGKPDNAKIQLILKYLEKFYRYYFDDTQNYKHWFNKNKILKAMYNTDIISATTYRTDLIGKGYSGWSVDFRELNLHSSILNNLLEEIVDLINVDNEHSVLSLIANYHRKPLKFIQYFEDFIENNPLSYAGLNLVKSFNPDKMFEILYDRFISGDNIKLETVSMYMDMFFERMEFDDFIPDVFNIQNKNIRNEIMQDILVYLRPFGRKKYPDLEEYLSKNLPKSYYSLWLEHVYAEDEDNWNKNYRIPLIKWLIQTYTFDEILNKVRYFKFRGFIDRLLNYYGKSFSTEEKLNLLRKMHNYGVVISRKNIDKYILGDKDKNIIEQSEEFTGYAIYDTEYRSEKFLIKNLSKYKLENDSNIFFASLNELFIYDSGSSKNAIKTAITKYPRLINDFYTWGSDNQKKLIKELDLLKLFLNNNEDNIIFLKNLADKNNGSESDILETALISGDLEKQKLTLFILSYGMYSELRRKWIPELIKINDNDINKSVKRILLSDILKNSQNDRRKIMSKLSSIIKSKNIVTPFNNIEFDPPRLDKTLTIKVSGISKHFEDRLLKLYNLNYDMRGFKMDMNIDDTTDFTSIFLDHVEIKNTEVSKEYITFFLKIMKTEENEDLLFNLLILEELILTDIELFTKMKDWLYSLLTNANELIVKQTQLLLICFEEENQLFEYLLSKNNINKVDEQSLWYGVYHRKDRSEKFFDLLKENIDDWDEEDIMDSLSKILPIVALRNDILIHIMNKILNTKSMETHSFFWNVYDFIRLDIRFIFIIKSFFLQNNVFNFTQDHINSKTEWVDLLFYKVNIKSKKTGNSFTKKLVFDNLNHNNDLIRICIWDFAIEKKYKKYYDFIADRENITIEELQFVLTHFERVEKRNLLEYLQISWDFIKNNKEKGDLLYLLKLLILNIHLCRELDTIVILSEIESGYAFQSQGTPLWNLLPKDGHEVREKLEIIKELYDENIPKFKKWIETLSKDKIKIIPFRFLGTKRAFDLYTWVSKYQNMDENMKQIYSHLFYIIFDKPHFTYPYIWKSIEKYLN